MFMTQEFLARPLLNTEPPTYWRGFGVGLHAPFLRLTTVTDDDAEHVYFLGGPNDLLLFDKEQDAGDPAELHMVLPPEASPTHDWHFQRVSRVERVFGSGGSEPSLVLVCDNGLRYSGFPLAPTGCSDEDGEALFEFVGVMP